MSLLYKLAAIVLMVMMAILGTAAVADAGTVVGVFPFQDTGAAPASHYGNGSQPESELLQASDGNFYGTTAFGGAGACPTDYAPISIRGCGTIFRINATTGIETVLYSFPYIAATGTAPEGANPSAGLIQGKDGALYGVASRGGNSVCGFNAGCGTLFRISTTGVFELLHQFCGTTGCPGVVEGAYPAYHLVQAADGKLYGVTQLGGESINFGTLFSASTSGAVTTVHNFLNGVDGGYPEGALLVGQDGSTLYGVTNSTVFSYGAAGLTTIHSFDDSYSEPGGALIFSSGGLLLGVTDAGNRNGSIYSLSDTGSDFAVDALLPGTYNATGLLLGSDGMIYGTAEVLFQRDGGVFTYDSTTKIIRPFVAFQTNTGGEPLGVLIEGKDHYLYGTNEISGGSNSFGPDEGTLFRIGPPLSP